MRYLNEKAVAPLGAVLCVCACLVGCGQKEDLPPAPAPAPKEQPAAAPKEPSPLSIEARAKDKEYQSKLQASVAAQRRTLSERGAIESDIAEMRARARKALPEGATEAQVLAELENNPKKYPAWRERVAAKKAILAEEQRSKAMAQAAFRQRVLREKSKGRAQDAASEAK